jgi:uncharacterized membrane protein YebE (DUF533 family)
LNIMGAGFMDARRLLDQFLGPDMQGKLAQAGDFAKRKYNESGGMGGFAGGAVTGGLLGVLLGNKSMRKMAGGVAGYGGAAVIGALAFRAFQAWQQGQAPSTVAQQPPAQLPPPDKIDERFLPSAQTASDGRPFELTLVQAMIAAAKADGHIDAGEQGRIFQAVEQQGLDAEAKAFVFDALSKPSDLDAVVRAARNDAQKSEIYLAARLAIDPDQPAERAFLEALAHKLALPSPLIAQLDAQVTSAMQAAA